MTIEKFLDEEVVDFASYSTLRAIGSAIDGLKNASRKVVFSLGTLPNKETKVSILSGLVMIKSEYLHGEISGSIIQIAQNHIGSNNIPLLQREGNFGTRFEPTASATRYIFTKKEDYFDDIFSKEYNDVLIEQEFEGTIIEPRFYIPTIPLILINGSEGIATGFAQKILPRNKKEVIQYIKAKLNNEELNFTLMPSFNGFRGSVSKGATPNQFLISGSFMRISSTRIQITELPIGYDLASYTKVLDDLEDKKLIKSYKDMSEDDVFMFEVHMEGKVLKNSDEMISDRLKLTKKVSENYTVIDEDNRIRVMNSAEEILDYYIDIKQKYDIKRKNNLIEKQELYLKELKSKYLFLEGVTSEKIKVNKTKKDDLNKALADYKGIIEKDGSFDYLLRIPIYNLTLEKLQETKDKILETNSNLEETRNKTVQATWIEELNQMEGI